MVNSTADTTKSVPFAGNESEPQFEGAPTPLETASMGRDDVLMLVRQGDWTPEMAEQWTRANNERPFAVGPDASEFDPSSEAFWTIAMSAAWISWRTEDAVRKYWNKYRNQCWIWKRREHVFGDGRKEIGQHLEQLDAICLSDVIRSARLGKPSSANPDVPRPIRDLWSHLQAGDLVANGILRGRFGIRTIPSIEWLTLSPRDFRRDVLDPIAATASDKPSYEEVWLPRNAILALWPAEPLTALKLAELETENLANRSAASPAIGPTTAKRRGRPPQYDWDGVKTEAFRLMNYHGDFAVCDESWSAQVRLEDALIQFCKSKSGHEPGISTVRGYLALWLAEWRQTQSAGKASN